MGKKLQTEKADKRIREAERAEVPMSTTFRCPCCGRMTAQASTCGWWFCSRCGGGR